MKKPIIPSNEKKRLENLNSYQLIGLEEQEEFDFLTSMASRICDTKISLISLITEDRQWFLSHHGLAARETPKDLAFCAHAINTPHEPFIIEDARNDHRFHDNPLTIGDPHVIFYAGIPLVSSSGYPLGTLCAIDNQPKKLSDHQIAELKKLAKICVQLFEKRKNEFKNNALLTELNEKNELLKETQDIHQIGNWELDIFTNQVKWSEQVYDIHELDSALDINKLTGINFYHPDYRNIISHAVEDCILNGQSFDMECLLITAKRNQKWVRTTGRKLNNKLIGSFQDITEIKSSNYKQKLILESTNVGTWEWNVQTGETIYNSRWAEIVGYTLEELAPVSIETWLNLVHPDDFKESEKRLQACFEGKSDFYELEARMKHKDGNWVWIYDRGKVLEWTEDGKPLRMYGTHQDISERKIVEEEIKRTNLLLEAAQHIAKMGAWELDVVTGSTFWTDEVYKIHEVDRHFDHNKESGIEFYHPDYRPVITNAITKSIQNNLPFDVKCKFITAKNNLRWVQSSGYPIIKEGKVVKLLGMFRDITEEEEAKEAIVREQSFSKQLLDNMGDGFSVVDSRGKQIGVNKALIEMTGFSEDELLGQTAPYPYWPLEEMDTIGKAFRQALAGEKNSFELILLRKNGQRFPSLISSGILRDENGRPISYFANVKDISARKKAEQEIKYQKQILDSLYQFSPIGIALNDYETGAFIDVNDKLLEPTGYTKEEFLTLNYWDITPTEYKYLEAKALQQMVETGKYDVFTKEYIRKNGTRYPISVQGVVVKDLNNKKFIWSFVSDISKEKEAERKLNDAISKLKAVLNASKQVAIIATDSNGIITLFNAGAEQMLGYAANELVGKQTPLVIHLQEEVDKESKLLSEKYGRMLNGFETFIYEAQMGQPNTKEWTYVDKNQHLIPVLLSVDTIQIENEIIGYLGVAADITELKKVENEIRSLLRITKEQNDRLKNFAHIVSHNLRSHSGGIFGLIEIIFSEHPDLVGLELMNLLKSGAQNLMQTVEDLTEIVKVNLTNEDMKPIHVFTMLEKNIRSLSNQINTAGITIINEISDDVYVKGIAAYIDSIFLNLITNAIKYRSDERVAFLRIYSEKEASTVTLFFEDNGLGIDLKIHGDKIFGMYKTFHRHDDSRGVGLFITKNQVERMGGKISVTSEVNKGSIFKITLNL